MEKEKLSSELSKIMKYNPKCPICGCSDFNQEEIELQLMSLLNERGQIVLKSGSGNDISYLNAIPLTCKKCGYILLFNSPMVKQ